MREISMVDLHGQYLKIKSEIDQAIQSVIESSSFIKGKEVTLFEDELSRYLGVENVIACANGTDALQVAMMALDLKPGDEVITTPFTFISTVEVIKLLGLTPKLVDIEEDSFNINVSHIEKAISERTRAIVPVHLFGQCVEMKALLELSDKYSLYIIEDTAQALGADYYAGANTKLKAGTLGTIGTTSFFPSKNLGGFGDGGALFTRDRDLNAKIRALVNHGMKERYYYDLVGVNSRLDTLQAAILRIKLRKLDTYHRARQEAASFYDRELHEIAEIQIPYRSPSSTHIFHQYTLQVPTDTRDSLKKWLMENNIPSMIYYPVPLHLQKAYRDLGYLPGDLPVSEALSGKVLSLPMHTELDEEQLQYITQKVKAFYEK